MVDPELERAIAFSRGGKKLEARQVLKAVLQTNLQNESAWLWMADTYAATEDRIKVLEECLKHIPESQVAQKWLATFKAEKEARLAAASQETLPDFQAGAAETVKTDSRTIFDQQLDCSGLDCPIPILRTKKALDGLKSGQVLKVIATDSSSVDDMKAWTSMTGHVLVQHEKDGEKFVFFIKHK